jgi:hypothetical protein
MARNLRCVLLCEDVEQESFFRPILQREFRRVRVEPRKPNGGSAFVLKQIPALATYLRQRQGEAVALLIVIDGDASGLQERLREIRERLESLNSDNRVAACVPCRTVETWELWLCGRHDLDEGTSYKDVFRHEVERGRMSAQQAVKGWLQQISSEQQTEEKTKLPARTHGREELKRLRTLARA